jgi:hypothetical protein
MVGLQDRTSGAKPSSIRKKKRGRVLDLFSIFAFVVSLLFFAFLLGVAVGEFHWFPYKNLRDVYLSVLRTPHPHHAHPVHYERSGVFTHDEDSVSPGLTLLTSYWPEFNWRPGIRLIDRSGKVLHRWRTDFASIWPEDMDAKWRYTHGCYLLPDGSVLANTEYVGTVRLDANGQVMWKLKEGSHHSITKDDDGNFWICAGKPFNASGLSTDAFPGLEAPYQEFALKISADGEVLRRLNILKAVYESEFRRSIYRSSHPAQGDTIHLNNIQPLPASLADSYPLFDAGDLAISCREIHLVAVLDGDTGELKWGNDQAFNAQHDPDFIGDGWIRVFDNNRERADSAEALGGSRIIDIQPHTGETRVVYPTDASDSFYTPECGKSQTLPNGNILITEAWAGRVFEVDPTTGKTVWEWIHEPYSEDPPLVAEVLQGTRYDISPETVKSWPKDEQ